MIEILLREIEKAVHVEPHEKGLITGLFHEKKYRKGDYFLKESDVCRHVGFIISGVMRYYINDDGEDKTYGFAKESDFVCNNESFLPQRPSRQIIQALEDCTLLVVGYNDLQTFYTSLKNGERFGRMVIEQVFVKTLRGLNSFYTDSPELRYEKFVKEYPDLLQRIPQYYIASYVGVKPQSLSRIRSRNTSRK
ncbi:Crp/Fnr family transcriptional regulator [Chryseobacterium sp. FH2]|uniref:Crp/Fnr family transcriptional regulator n=1 Tax=Chryseobacterium sp. FH2 TaxID=1674291 RepID=UPI00065AE003|nr:Crp/Fnr family transcriptional regulator [Chryseobacterium sp. FH2]KMQ65334.1 Crp/Fnr family transcriptional regulator [Chryseobacterium sp. FH2]